MPLPEALTTYLSQKGLTPFPYQEETWRDIMAGKSGLVNAPTGYGKTYAVLLGWVEKEGLVGFAGLGGFAGSEEKEGLAGFAGLEEKEAIEGFQRLSKPTKLTKHTKPTKLTKPAKPMKRLLWITPLRALAKDIARAMEEVINDLNLPLRVGIRNGDTPTSERQKQKKDLPEILIITPESLHLLMAQKGYEDLLGNVGYVAVDEWHELLGSKRGVQVELALSRLAALKKKKGQSLSVWGMSATIGNLEEAKEVLLAPLYQLDTYIYSNSRIISCHSEKKTDIIPIIPDQVETYPWAGHMGLRMCKEVVEIIKVPQVPHVPEVPQVLQVSQVEISHQPTKLTKLTKPAKPNSTLIFINTRGMSEQWYHALLNQSPELAGAIALHHGSIEKELRDWVEDALHTGTLKAVVCTASLDLGVDFRPVEKVIQVGSPKGVARFLQRAGRSGHRPGETSIIYFLPTHSLELLEIAALREAAENKMIESRQPQTLCFDVLLQYICTLAVSDGFRPDDIYNEIKSTYCFREMEREEWDQLLHFLVHGGKALKEYDEYKKVEITDGVYRITNRKIAMRHRLNIGTIVSDAMLKVKMMSGGFVGMIEEYFISRLKPGDVFSLAGRNLEFVMLKEMTVLARKSSSKKAIVPSWNGGRMPLSANLGFMLRKKLDDASHFSTADSQELKSLRPLLELQRNLSALPRRDELLVEMMETKYGHHLFVYPFEGRLVHEALAALLAWRISRQTPISFSFAMNDYGFELISDQPIPVNQENIAALFSEENLLSDIYAGVNATEMARRKFRDISVIGGLLFQGMPGNYQKPRHLQASASLLFDVFSEYEPDNLLVRQAYREVMEQQMEETRLRSLLRRINNNKIIITRPEKFTPFCFPIVVDSMRESMSSEKLEDRVRRMVGEV